MALVLADRVQETSTTTGTGTLTLDGAVLGYQTFSAGIGSGNTCYYAITSGTGAWEVGIGTVGTGTLARTTLLSSSTGSLVSFTGTLNVYVTYPSEKSVNLDASNVMSGYAISGGTINGTTVGSTTAAAGSFTTLNSSGATRLGGASGNQSLQVNNVASAVNYLQAVGAVTGGSPTLSALGTDANIGLSLASKGTSGVTIDSTTATNFLTMNDGATTRFSFVRDSAGSGSVIKINSGIASIVTTDSSTGTLSFKTNTTQEQVRISPTASAVNYLNLTGAATGAAPTISAQGSDANIGLVLTGKGTGVVALGGSTVANSGVQVFPIASSVNYLALTGATAGNSPALGVGGTNANVSFIFQTKGSGGYGFYTNYNTAQAAISHTASAVNYLQLTGAVTTGAPELSAQGSDANINLKLTPKGTGVVTTTSITLSNTLTTAAYTETIVASGTVGASATLAITAGTVLTATLTSATACTFTMPTATAGKSFTLLLKQPAAGTPTTATFTNVKWNSGGAPTITATLGRLDILAFVADGTNWYGTASQGYTY